MATLFVTPAAQDFATALRYFVGISYSNLVDPASAPSALSAIVYSVVHDWLDTLHGR